MATQAAYGPGTGVEPSRRAPRRSEIGPALVELVARCFESAGSREDLRDWLTRLAHIYQADGVALFEMSVNGPTLLTAAGTKIPFRGLRAALSPPLPDTRPETGSPPEPSAAPADADRLAAAPAGVELVDTGRVINAPLDAGEERAGLGLALHRGPPAGPFTAAEALCIGEAARILGRALRVHGTVPAALDPVATGAAGAVLEADGRVASLTGLARTLVDRDDGLSLVDGRLGFEDPAAERGLADFLARLAAGQTPAPVGLRAARRTFATPLRVLLRPAPGDRRGPRAVALFHDPEHAPLPDWTLLAAVFALTPAETALVARLYADRSLPEAAEQLGISAHTARTHLRHVFTKLGVRSQSALVRRIAESIPALALQAGAAHD